jgi:hypothetical protein
MLNKNNKAVFELSQNNVFTFHRNMIIIDFTNSNMANQYKISHYTDSLCNVFEMSNEEDGDYIAVRIVIHNKNEGYI